MGACFWSIDEHFEASQKSHFTSPYIRKALRLKIKGENLRELQIFRNFAIKPLRNLDYDFAKYRRSRKKLKIASFCVRDFLLSKGSTFYRYPKKFINLTMCE